MQIPEPQPDAMRSNSVTAYAVRRIGSFLADAFAHAAAFALLFIVGICAINVTRRYLFGAAWSWAEEAMVFMMIFIVFAGAVTVTWRNTHMRIELVIDRLPAPIRSVAVLLGTFVVMGVLGTMSYFSAQVVTTLYGFEQKTDALEMPMWIPQSLVAVGFGLCAVLAAMRLYVHGTARGQTELDVVAKDKL